MAKKKRKIRSKRHRKKKRTRMWRRIGYGVGIIVLIIGLAAGATHIDAISVNNITVSGNSVTATEDIKEIAQSRMSGSYAFVFSKDSSALYPKNAIIDQIKEEYPRIEDISVELSDLTSLAISVKEREPHGLWCEGSIEGIGKKQNCYFLDKSGLIYSKAPQFSGFVFFRYYGDISKDDPLGAQYLKQDSFRRVRQFVDALREELDLNPVAYASKKSGDGRVKLVKEKKGELGGAILFSPDDNLSTVFENLKALLSKGVFEEEVQKKGNSLDYIDLRYGNKVYYRMKGEDSQKENTDSE